MESSAVAESEDDAGLSQGLDQTEGSAEAEVKACFVVCTISQAQESSGEEEEQQRGLYCHFSC